MRSNKTVVIPVVILLLLHWNAAEFITSFINDHFHANETIVIISTNFHNWKENLQVILSLKNPKIITTIENEQEIPSLIKNYIVVEDDFQTLDNFIMKIEYSINTRGHFLMIIQKNITEEELKIVFRRLLIYYIYNVVILANWTEFFTWYPYNSENHCGKVVNLVIKQKNVFKDKLPKDLGGCSFNITWSNLTWTIKSPFDKSDPGYAIISLYTIAEKLNLQLDFLREQLDYFSFAIRDGNFKELCKYVAKEKIDVSFTIGVVSQKYCPQLETTNPILQYKQNFVFPPRKSIINNGKPIGIFRKAFWWTFLASFFTMWVFWKIVTKQSYHNSFFVIIQLVVQCMVSKVPQKQLPRFVLFIFLYFTMNINWFYVSQMSSVLTEPTYEPHIKKIEDIVKYNKKLKFIPFFRKHLQIYGDATCEKLMALRVEGSDSITTHDAYLQEFVDHANYGTIMQEIDFVLFRDYEKLQVLSHENIMPAAVIWSVRTGFPLKERFDYWISRIVESGLVFKWMQDTAVALPKYNFSDNKIEKDVALKFDHVLLIFEIWVVGLAMSFACFVGEVLWQRQSTSIQ